MAGRHLYILQSRTTGAIKIGRSDEPETRLKQIQTGSSEVLKLILVKTNGGESEKRIHHAMARHRTRHVYGGEWFAEHGMGDLPLDLWEHFRPWYLENPDWWK